VEAVDKSVGLAVLLWVTHMPRFKSAAPAPRQHGGATLGLRPEHIALAREPGVEARIDGIEYLGADSLITCKVAGRPVAVRVAGRVGLSSGDTVHLAWARGAQHFFAPSGARIEDERAYSPATMLA